ncbi:type II toxin-antitoxin system VapC family toxin [Sphingomonas sp. DT-51]|uniref:type II toxin-antitoxin system VapC family toxin n=1 Tax=Sphingomonas sp. DT-51 TaxID=3396165 RepID=UPI003F53EE97
MLDTNIVSDLMRNPQGQVFDRILRIGSDRICVSVITAAEIRYDCAKKGSTRLLDQAEAILSAIEVVPFDVPADAEYGGIRSELEAAGKTIGPNDLLIAAHAYALGLVLVTNNVDEFRRVRGLTVENWLD